MSSWISVKLWTSSIAAAAGNAALGSPVIASYTSVQSTGRSRFPLAFRASRPSWYSIIP